MAGTDVVVQAFTKLAPSYEEIMDRELRRFWGMGYEPFIDQLIGMIPVDEGDAVLDVATGKALVPLRIAGKVGAEGQVVGLDITLAMLQQGQKDVVTRGSSSRINLVCASAMDMSFLEGAFDAVICGLGMHHMDVAQVLSEMKRVLKDGGTLLIAALGAHSFWKRLGVKRILRIIIWLYYMRSGDIARAWAEAEDLLNIRTASEWHAVLSDFGFTNIEIAESAARHRWYPCALTIRAMAGST